MSRNWQQSVPSPEAYWMGKVLYDIHHRPDDLARYRADPLQYLQAFPLSEELKRAIIDNDIGRMYRSGVNPYLLRAHCIGLRIPEAVFTASLAAVRE
jgi:protocatechuate 4,5-dioxygenase alpha chain